MYSGTEYGCIYLKKPNRTSVGAASPVSDLSNFTVPIPPSQDIQATTFAMKSALILSFLAACGLSAGQMPNLCLASPPVEITAGLTPVSASVYNPLGSRCIATLNFENAEFLPVSYVFKSPQCPRQVQSFQAPLEAPDGGAFITWQCAGKAPTCSHAVISGGQANNSLELQQTGNVSCVDQVLQTSTSQTTIARGSSTFVETVRSVLTSLTTRQVLPTSTAPGPTTVQTDTATVKTGTTATAAPTSGPPSATDTGLATETRVTSAGKTAVSSLQAPSSAAILQESPSKGGDPLGFSATSSGSKITPSVIVTAMISTITVVQTMATVVTACVSE
ncbi:hypothetical protein B0T14DRAFT_501967 [Immersiella caudata]|uniref:Uncharacterized protein n=1 Tax=Immersiella caudata TaxID=314043 RepID=A0AA39XDB1_9PEZI|nr:hypothetical protein B0T14DRAFT_501967 [Immersiella caudata]